MTKKTSRNRNIEIIGARVNNLKNISAKIPHKQMTVFTGPSGSGKTSMVFDVIYAEAYRRYMSTLESSFVRNFVPMLEKPDVDEITGLQAVICIGQELVQHRTSRSTVGTLTEIYTLLRLLYARIAEAHSYKTGKRMIRLSYKEIEKQLWQDFKGDRLTFLAPLKVVRKGLLVQLGKRYEGLMVNGERKSIKANRSLTYYDNQEVALIVAEHLEVTAGQEHKIKKAIQEAMNHGKGVFGVKNKAGKVTYLSRFLMEHATGLIYPDPSPVTFSFNTKEGACPKCEGKGEVKKIIGEDVINLFVPTT
ncbi:MAG: excinuclease ABC subunit UvrA, partial [Cytophagales bacterium]